MGGTNQVEQGDDDLLLGAWLAGDTCSLCLVHRERDVFACDLVGLGTPNLTHPLCNGERAGCDVVRVDGVDAVPCRHMSNYDAAWEPLPTWVPGRWSV